MRTGSLLLCWLISEFGMNKTEAADYLVRCHERYRGLCGELLPFVIMFARQMNMRSSESNEIYQITHRNSSEDAVFVDPHAASHSVPPGGQLQ
jgi:hypothetical protein